MVSGAVLAAVLAVAAGHGAPGGASTEITVDLGDGWLPAVLNGTPEQPQPLQPRLVDLVNERFGGDRQAREDRYLEVYGLPPSVSVVARRLGDERRHRCHDGVADGALGAWLGAPAARRPPDVVRAEVRAAQAHLACDGLLDRRARTGRLDRWTAAALRAYQRMHALASHGHLDEDTRIALVTDSRELDFRALLRVLRERVADAAGLLEDGTALGGPAPVLDRTLDSGEFRSGLARAALSGRPVRAAPDLVSPATEAAARALGWTSPEAAAVALRDRPARVVVAIAAPPAWHARHMDLRAEIDRGDVHLAPPLLDGQGRPRPRRSRRKPTLTIFARDDQGELALARWPTTIGGWKATERRDGMALEYKESRVGRAFWRDLLATPTWHPPPGTPARRLVRRGRGGWEIKREVFGPGYRAAYGLVALVHLNEAGARNPDGTSALIDYRIRTHGSPAYQSIGRGESHGCHRLYNHLALRLAGFLLRHRDHVRHGPARETYERALVVDDATVPLELRERGYRFELTPPVPVDVLEGQVSGSRRAVGRRVPLARRP